MLAFRIIKNPNPKQFVPIMKYYLPKCKIPLIFFSKVQEPTQIVEVISEHHQSYNQAVSE